MVMKRYLCTFPYIPSITCIYIYIYIYIYNLHNAMATHMHIYAHTHTHTQDVPLQWLVLPLDYGSCCWHKYLPAKSQRQVYVSLDVCKYMHVYVCMHLPAKGQRQVYVSLYVCKYMMCMYVCICLQRVNCKSMCIFCLYICMCMHVYACVCIISPLTIRAKPV